MFYITFLYSYLTEVNISVDVVLRREFVDLVVMLDQERVKPFAISFKIKKVLSSENV